MSIARVRVPALLSLLSLSLVTGCPTPVPDPTPVPGSGPYDCPVIPTQLGSCSDFHVMRSSLTCGDDGKMQAAVGQAGGGANRFVVQFKNGSRFQGSLIHNDPPCNIQDGTDADFTFGAVYTGDQGEETAADGSIVPCVTQSKVDWSSFNFDLILMAPHEGFVKARIHETFDVEVINTIFQAQGKPRLVGRCQRWRPWSQCGDGIVEGEETCDDGNQTAGDGCAPSCRGA